MLLLRVKPDMSTANCVIMKESVVTMYYMYHLFPVAPSQLTTARAQRVWGREGGEEQKA